MFQDLELERRIGQHLNYMTQAQLDHRAVGHSSRTRLPWSLFAFLIRKARDCGPTSLADYVRTAVRYRSVPDNRRRDRPSLKLLRPQIDPPPVRSWYAKWAARLGFAFFPTASTVVLSC